MPFMFIFGLGYTAKRLADALTNDGWKISATGSDGDVDFSDREAVLAALSDATHVLSSVPPDRDSGLEPVLETYGEDFPAAWYGYLSSTGVYGDAAGAWVDEASPTGTGRRSARSDADALWMKRQARVFRLPGIYGPDRSALDKVRDGSAHRIDMSGQVFSRVHVDDIVGGVVRALETEAPPGAYNLGDDLPASHNSVTEEACRLLGVDPPPLQTMDEAGLSPMARGFYAENRRVANSKAKRMLGWRLRYPTYREGLRSLL